MNKLKNSGNKDSHNDIPEDVKKQMEKASKIERKLMSMFIKLGLTLDTAWKLYKDGKNPFEARKLILQFAVGLRTNSIIGNPLYYPNSGDLEGELQFQNASAGLWNVYDFEKAFSRKLDGNYSQFGGEVDLLYFPLENRFINSDTDPYIETPEGLFNLFDINDLLFFSKFRVEEALEYGAIKEVSYEEAYSNIGNPAWEQDVKEFQISDKPVYQVTPKGNTLIIPDQKGGNRTPRLKDGKTSKNKGGFQPVHV